jgi:hypothetical protein
MNVSDVFKCKSLYCFQSFPEVYFRDNKLLVVGIAIVALAGAGIFLRQKWFLMKWKRACRRMDWVTKSYTVKRSAGEKTQEKDTHDYPGFLMLKDSFVVTGLAEDLASLQAKLGALTSAMESARDIVAVERLGHRFIFRLAKIMKTRIV